MIKKIILIFIFIANICAYGNSPESYIKSFDVRLYNPINFGLKDLRVKARIKDLTSKLNEQLVFGKLKDVYFEFYWKAPDKIKVEVFGMPEGFKEVKDQLKQGILLRSDFIIPRALSEKVKGYELKLDSEKGKTSITAVDTKGVQAHSEIIYLFNENDVLNKSILKSAMGMETLTMNFDKRSWSQNKLVLGSYTTQRVEGVNTISTEVQVKYEKVGTYGFPKSIQSKTKQVLTQPVGKKKQTYEREFTSEISFFDHQVNTGLKNVTF